MDFISHRKVLQASIYISSATIKNVSPCYLQNLYVVLWVDPKYKQKHKITRTLFLNTYTCDTTIYIPLRASLDDSILYIDIIHATSTFPTDKNDGDLVVGSVVLPLREVGIGLIHKTKSKEIFSSGYPRGEMVLEIVVHDYTSYHDKFPCKTASTNPSVGLSESKKISTSTSTSTSTSSILASKDCPPYRYRANSTAPYVMPSVTVPPQVASGDYHVYQGAYSTTIPDVMPSPPVVSQDYPPSAPPAPYEHWGNVDAPAVAGYPCYPPPHGQSQPFNLQPHYGQVNWTKTIFGVGVGVGIFCGVALGMGFGYVQEMVKHVVEWACYVENLLKDVLGLILAFFLAREIDRRFFNQ